MWLLWQWLLPLIASMRTPACQTRHGINITMNAFACSCTPHFAGRPVMRWNRGQCTREILIVHLIYKKSQASVGAFSSLNLLDELLELRLAWNSHFVSFLFVPFSCTWAVCVHLPYFQLDISGQSAFWFASLFFLVCRAVCLGDQVSIWLARLGSLIS